MAQLPYEIEIPDKFVQHFRVMTGDLPQYNRLIEGTESSDEKIRLAAQMFIQNFNGHPPETNIKYVFTDFPNYQLLVDGMMIQLLRWNGILNTRNFLNFNDGGVSFTVNDKGAEYMQWIQQFLQTHTEHFMQVKTAINAGEGFGYISSPEDFQILETLY